MQLPATSGRPESYGSFRTERVYLNKVVSCSVRLSLLLLHLHTSENIKRFSKV